MASGMWTAVSGASAQAQSVDVVSNNLANMDTLGFKKDLPTFKEYLSSIERERAPREVPRGPIKEKDFFQLEGRDQAFVVVDGTYTNFKPGTLRVTQAPLDFALDGPGFFEVSTPSGVRYTRQGSLKMATDGRLVTREGYPVLAVQPGGLAIAPPATTVQPGQGGLPTQGGVAAELGLPPGAQAGSPQDPNVVRRMINLRDRNTNLSVNDSGEIFAGEELVAKLNVVEFVDPRKLRKTGGQLFENPDTTNVSGLSQQTVVRQRVLETSNVNPAEEMTNLIKANRLFEHDLKTIKTFSELMGKEANEIGKL